MIPSPWRWPLTILVFFVTRLSIVPIVLNFQMDEILYRDWAVSIGGGQFPVGDEWYQYPPGAGLLFLGVELLPTDFHRALTLTMIGADVLIFALLLGKVARSRASWMGPWAWIVGGSLAGGLLYERFDVIPTLLAVLAVLWASRPFWSGMLAGIGAMVKVWPIFALFAVARRDFAKALAGALVGIAGITILATAVASDSWGFFAGQSGRGLQIESTPAAPLLIAAQLGLIAAPTRDRYGSNELDTPWAPVAAWICIVVAVVLLAILLIQYLRGRLDGVPGADVAVTALLVFWAFNRVNSSQFFIWVAGLGAVALLVHRSRMLVPLVLAFASMLTVDDYLGPYFWALQGQVREAVAIQVLRALLVLGSAVLAWWLAVSRGFRLPAESGDGVPLNDVGHGEGGLSLEGDRNTGAS